MRKMWKRLMALLCVSVMVLSGFSAMAAESTTNTNFDVSGSKKASPQYILCPETETTVTLSLPSAEYQNEIDIVFTMDSSTSSESGTAFTNSVNALFASILENNPNIKLKVGVVRFRGRAFDALDYLSDGANKGLVVYSDDTKALIEKALSMTEAEVKAAFGNGSNTHAGLVLADELLEADTDVEKEKKYVVLLTDGKSYIWYNDKNEPTTIYSQYMRRPSNNTVGSVGIASNGMPTLNQSAGYDKYGYGMDVLDPTNRSNIYVFSSFEALYNSTDSELTGSTKWDQPCYYADDKTDVPKGSVTKRATTNGAELFPYNDWRADYQAYFEYVPEGKWADIAYLQANPYSVIDNGDGTYTFDKTTINPDYYQYHADCLQKGVYIAAHYWADMLEKYNCAAITYLNSTDAAVSGVAVPFNAWLRDISKYGAEADNPTAVQEMFTNIDNDIRYMVASGVVTDVIADPFTLKNADKAEGFKMTLEGTELTPAYESGKWTFANGDYVVEYDASTKTITWTINVAIENAKPITLSYVLEVPEGTKAGDYDTNKSAVLNYVTSDQKPGEYTFEVPKVGYMTCIDVKVTKIWVDDNDAAGMRPKEVEVILDGPIEDYTLKLNEANGWTDTFGHVHDMHVRLGDFIEVGYEVWDYELKEVAVENYECVITGNYKDGFVITNTYVPPTTEEETTTEAETTAPETTEEETTPPTGDVNILPFAGMFLLAAAAVCLLLRVGKAKEQ